MLVVDASAIVDLILNMPPHAASIARRLQAQPVLAAPHLLDAEVAAALRNRVLRGKLPSSAALAAIEDLLALSIERFPHAPLLSRAFALRDNASLYDALYLALAETLEAPLLTRDRRLAGVPGTGARVEVVGGSA